MTANPETALTKKMMDAGRKDYGDRLVTLKYHGDQYAKAGVSDTLHCLDGVFVAIEVKSPKSSQHRRKTEEASIQHALEHGPTVLQRAFVQHVLDAGGCAGFAATVEQYNEILDHAALRATEALVRQVPCFGHNTGNNWSGSDADRMFPETEE